MRAVHTWIEGLPRGGCSKHHRPVYGVLAGGGDSRTPKLLKMGASVRDKSRQKSLANIVHSEGVRL